MEETRGAAAVRRIRGYTNGSRENPVKGFSTGKENQSDRTTTKVRLCLFQGVIDATVPERVGKSGVYRVLRVFASDLYRLLRYITADVEQNEASAVVSAAVRKILWAMKVGRWEPTCCSEAATILCLSSAARALRRGLWRSRRAERC